jgi:hypothetical protein
MVKKVIVRPTRALRLFTSVVRELRVVTFSTRIRGSRPRAATMRKADRPPKRWPRSGPAGTPTMVPIEMPPKMTEVARCPISAGTRWVPSPTAMAQKPPMPMPRMARARSMVA